MRLATSGLHHVTAIAGDPQRNADFYLRTLGLRLVKTTVNFDDPATYHLYYGDSAGRPGSLLTFFPWRDVAPGHRGNGQATTTSFSVPETSIGWWRDHLAGYGITVSGVQQRDGEEAIAFRDPDGLALSLVAHQGVDPRHPWESPFVPPEHAITGLHSVTLSVAEEDDTLGMLGGMGLAPAATEGNRIRYAAGDGGPGTFVDVLVQPKAARGLVAGGTVHHVAWRAPDAATQASWRADLVDDGVKVTEIMDRQYFTSIYFREPAGTLLEIATDNPGFAVDEPLLELGRALKLPPWLEPNRAQIERALPPLRLPDGQEAAAEQSPAVSAED